MKIYRAMTASNDGLPEVGRSARKIGVRTLDMAPHNDVDALQSDDLVAPGDGMWAAPIDPANLPKNRRPTQLGGIGKDPVWELETADLDPGLEFVQDSPTHGVVSARIPMRLADFERALEMTRPHWRRVIG